MSTAERDFSKISNKEDYSITRISAPEELEEYALLRIRDALSRKEKGSISIGLPGGRSIGSVVRAIKRLTGQELKGVTLQIIDERLTGEKNIDTLLDAGLGNLLEEGVMQSSQIKNLFPGSSDLELFDLLFAGIGEDGHFASLFPGSYPKLDNPETPAVLTIDNSPKPPPERVTITYTGFRHLAKSADIFLLFLGEGKRSAYNAFMDRNGETAERPCLFFHNFKNREKGTLTLVTDLQ